MGYFSEVRIATKREAYDLMCEKVDFLSDGHDSYPLMGAERPTDFFDEKGDSVVFGWDNIKWNESLFVDVRNVLEALDEIGEGEFPYEFCRIGEDWDDIVFRTSGCNEELELHVEPSVAIDVF